MEWELKCTNCGANHTTTNHNIAADPSEALCYECAQRGTLVVVRSRY